MKLLVTGGCGFIGSNFIHYWLKNHGGDEIVNLDKLTYAADPSNLKGIDNSRYEFVKGDIADASVVDPVVNDSDAVVNFAAESHVDRSIVDSGAFIHSNIAGVHVLLEAARRYDKRIHQVSTDEVYGTLSLDSDEKFTERSAYAPRNPYAATKASADHLARAYFNTHGVKVTISNCGNNMGPRQHEEKLIPKTIINAINGSRIPVYGNGMQVRDWIHVDDHCSAIESILSDGAIGETYIISAGYERRNIDVVKRILQELGVAESAVEHVRDRPGHDIRYALDSSKIRDALGWKPSLTFEEGLRKTIQWYKNRGGANGKNM